jgi:hypothetical protein
VQIGVIVNIKYHTIVDCSTFFLQTKQIGNRQAALSAAIAAVEYV